MVAINTAYPSTTSYVSLATTLAASAKAASATDQSSDDAANTSATNVTLSDAAKAAIAVKDFTTVIAEARSKLTTLLTDANRKSPLEKDKLALNLSSLDQREIYAMASDKSFSADEQKAAGLEMQRRFEAALSGPAAVAKVTGTYTGLYKAAAEYLDTLSAEEKAEPDWITARAAVTDGLKQLQADPKKLPAAGKDDPVAIYLQLQAAGGGNKDVPIADVATGARKTLDALYADALAGGKAPTFNKDTKTGNFIDLGKLDSRTLSSIALDQTGQFSADEVRAANSTLRSKSGAALVAGFQSAAKSSDPTAFSQNIISMYASMTADERQATGWSPQFYEAALNSYQSTTKLLNMFAEAGGSSTSFLSWMGK